MHNLINLIVDKFQEINRDGKKAIMSAESRCFCYKNHTDSDSSTDTKLRLCQGCNLAKYCSRACQTDDWSSHKADCTAISKAYKKMVFEKTKLLSVPADFMNPNPAEVFETCVGNFWGMLDPRDYCRARYSYAAHILDMTRSHNYAYIIEASLRENLALLRLCSGDNMGLRDMVLFMLIRLNRDQDCYRFIKYWILDNEKGVQDYGWAAKFSDGEWIYGECESFESVSNDDILKIMDKSQYELAFAVALCAIVIRQHNAKLASLHIQRNAWNELNLLTELCSDKVQDFVGVSESNIKVLRQEHKTFVDCLLRRVNKANATILRAIVNPAPIRACGKPGAYSHGTPEEGHLIFEACDGIFQDIPGAVEMIESVVGTNPHYELPIPH